MKRGYGIVTNPNAYFEPDGTLVFENDGTVWDDIRITLGSFDRPGSNDPVYVLYYPSGGAKAVYTVEFAKNDFASFTVQIPHKYKEGSDIYAHLHWTPGANGVAENGHNVGWKLDYSWANINGVFGAVQTLYLTDACDGVNHKHLMTPDVVISGENKGISSMLLCNVFRSDTGTDDTWAATASGSLPLLLEVDFHFELDTMGSRERASK